MEHKLKILPTYFEEVRLGNKTFELRKNDRPYNIGDILILQEFDSDGYTKKELTREITYILQGGYYGLDKDYCILGIKEVCCK